MGKALKMKARVCVCRATDGRVCVSSSGRGGVGQGGWLKGGTARETHSDTAALKGSCNINVHEGESLAWPQGSPN